VDRQREGNGGALIALQNYQTSNRAEGVRRQRSAIWSRIRACNPKKIGSRWTWTDTPGAISRSTGELDVMIRSGAMNLRMGVLQVSLTRGFIVHFVDAHQARS